MFEELANVRAGDVKPPVNLPAGKYDCTIAGSMSPHTAKSKNVAMRFPCSPLEVIGDVDQDALQLALENKPLADRKFNMDFWMSPDARFRFTDFCRSCGVFDENLTLVQLAERLVEEKPRFTAELTYRENTEDPTKPPFPNWDNFVGYEEAAGG